MNTRLFAVFLLVYAAAWAQTVSPPNAGGAGSGTLPGYTTVAFSATPTFTATASAPSTSFLLTLTGNVTSSTFTGGVTGGIYTFRICQDGTGSRTFVPPANVLNMGTIDPTASSCSQQTFVYDGSNAQALGVMLVTGISGSAISLPGSTSGTATLQPAAIAGGTQTLPNATGTLGVITGSPANNDCAKIAVSGSTYTLTTAGAACGSGSSNPSVVISGTGGLSAVTSSTTYTQAATVTLPSLATGDKVCFDLLVTKTGTAGYASFRHKIAGTVVWSSDTLNAIAGDASLHSCFLVTAATTITASGWQIMGQNGVSPPVWRSVDGLVTGNYTFPKTITSSGATLLLDMLVSNGADSIVPVEWTMLKYGKTP